MKIILLIFVLIAACSAFSEQIIRNTKVTGIIDDIAGDYCEWDGSKVFPGSISIYKRGRCRQLQCSDDFDMIVTSCPFDMTGRYTWVNPNLNKPYPECCGDKKDNFMAAERV